MISKRQFDILTYLLESEVYVSQRDLSNKLDTSLGTINNDMKDLAKMGYVESGKISLMGIEALNPYKVQRAIFIAAGFGSRMLPIILNTPKPLIKVKGIRIIETMLDAVIKAGIEEIYIVRGYLSSNFDVLLEKYPMIQFVKNEDYIETNNISSAIKVKDKFKNAYVFDADLFLYNSNLITTYQFSSNYLGIPTERTDDWCLKTKNDRVTGMYLGGEHCYRMVGMSYWTQSDGERIEKDIEEVYSLPGGKERFWDQVILDYHIENYNISVRECSSKDVVEVNTFSELKELDDTSRKCERTFFLFIRIRSFSYFTVRKMYFSPKIQIWKPYYENLKS